MSVSKEIISHIRQYHGSWNFTLKLPAKSGGTDTEIRKDSLGDTVSCLPLAVTCYPAP